VKRVFDILFSLIMIILTLPLTILICAAIAVTSPGPILFKQKRVGQYCKNFNIFKFRTMYHNTPKDIPTHLLESPDTYITGIGKFLRKTSLDELPQLINVLKGEMSFVGPRPALYNQYDLIELREKFNVNDIRPGITGWAQINGRDELSIPQKVEYDRQYILHMSLVFDIKIIFLTIFHTLLQKGVVEGKT
jgi:O-antigen biosynthesis protein WbqP